MCDLVAVTGGAAVCTLRATTTGYVDLTAYCPGSLTPAAACAAASGGSCRLTKLYDLVAGTNPFIQATLANMPNVVFSTLNGLPAVQCVSANSTNLTTTSTVTIAQPYYLTAVYERTASFTSLASALGVSGLSMVFGSNTSANNALLTSASPSLLATMSDGTGPSDFTHFHSMIGIANNTTSVLTIDGADTSGSAGALGITALGLRFCRGNAVATPDGYVMEGYFGPSATSLSSGDRTAINSNQHSATSGYNF